MKCVAIIQARMGSTRLPGKVLADVHGRPMLSWLLDRVKAVPLIDEIVIATTTDAEDDRLAQWIASQTGVGCFRGSRDDVLRRFAECARQQAADVVVRVTADDPLKDPGVIQEAIARLRADPRIDYCSNTIRPTYPEGVDIEAFRMSALARAHEEAALPSEREHVTPYIWKHPDKFRLDSMEFERDLSHWRWTVDRPADLEFVRAIYAQFIDRPLVPLREIIAYIEQHRELLLINSGTARDEGYLKSLEMERK